MPDAHAIALPPPTPDPRVANIFHARRVAVVGASRDPRNLGRRVLENIKAGGFQGRLYAVNPHAEDIAGVPTFARVGDIPDRVDLAIVAVPAAAVLRVVEECADADIRSLVIITAGFRETGDDGAKREAELAESLRGRGVRAVGPNCMGVLNTDPAVRLNATFAPELPASGPVAFVSQSGALGIALLAMAKSLGLGIRYFASLGNKTNLSTNDLLAQWEHDGTVSTILLYLENFGNPRNFLALARRLSHSKTIIAVKSGRSSEGAAAARTHTGALAEPDRAAEALFDQSGVIRAQSVEEMFDLARAFSNAPLPQGKRVAIVTNSGGPGILATDALRSYEIPLAELSPETVAAISPHLPPGVAARDPLDLIASASPEAYRASMHAILEDPNVDALLVIYTPPMPDEESRVVDAIIGQRHATKPVLACVMGRETGSDAFRRLNRAHVPAYAFPENMVRALAAMIERGARLQLPPPAPIHLRGIQQEDAQDRISLAVATGREWLEPDDTLALLADYGIPTVPTIRAVSPEDVGRLAPTLGPKVAIKAIAATLIHKTEANAIRLGVDSSRAADAARAVEGAARAHGHAPTAYLVQEMAAPATELILGVQVDPKFGPMVLAGLGGVYSEILRDTTLRLAPLTPRDAEEMLTRLRAWPVLAGARGRQPADKGALIDALLRLSRLVVENPAIRELDINPILAYGEGALVVDARVRLWPRGEAPRAAAVLPELSSPRA